MKKFAEVVLFAVAVMLVGRTFTPAETANFREFYVAPTGSDANPGSLDKPFATLDHARDIVRSINGQMTGNIVVHSTAAHIK